MARSNAYWSANLYRDPKTAPKPAAPIRDLPPHAARRFQMLRDGLLGIEGVTEAVRYVNREWNWAWEYSVRFRRLGWLHVMEMGVGGTFVLTQEDERRVEGLARLSGVIREAIRGGLRTGPVRWCWLEFADRKAIEAFLGFMRRKAEWIRTEPEESPVYRRSKAG
ncbi:MAG: hypothetical protein AB7I33_12300 [Gemmatimonadales bacterium]